MFHLSAMQDFTKVRAWQSAREFFVDVYHTTKTFPEDERYGFSSQMRPAARSICANIAEGCGYSGGRDSLRFHRMGFGSSSESYSDLYLARDVELLLPADFDRLEARLVKGRKELSLFMGAIERRVSTRRR
jgi:four helix bundle protein